MRVMWLLLVWSMGVASYNFSRRFDDIPVSDIFNPNAGVNPPGYCLCAQAEVIASPQMVRFNWKHTWMDHFARYEVLIRNVTASNVPTMLKGSFTTLATNLGPVDRNDTTPTNEVYGTDIYYNVSIPKGQVREILIKKKLYTISNKAYYSNTCNYFLAGIEAPAIEDRGTLVLLVESSLFNTLQPELQDLRNDLVGDGYKVEVASLNRSTAIKGNVYVDNNPIYDAAGVISTKKVIDQICSTTNCSGVYLVGHLPYPYSGNLAPDAHYDQAGAKEADLFYGSLSNATSKHWTDSSVNATWNTKPLPAIFVNVPGDGKFDPSYIPSNYGIELFVGRIDAWNMPSFSAALGSSEEQKLRFYLNKAHHWKNRSQQFGKQTDPNFTWDYDLSERAIVNDQDVTAMPWEHWMQDGFRNAAAMFGHSNLYFSDMFDAANETSFAYCYRGEAISIEKFIPSPTNHFRCVFGGFARSHIMDMDSEDAPLRQWLFSSHGLTSAWIARPSYFFHKTAMGYSFGDGQLLSANNVNWPQLAYCNTNDWPGYSAGGIHVNMIGDPTLRLHPVTPVSGLTLLDLGVSGIRLSWIASTSSGLVGHYVYRCSSVNGPCTRISGTTFLASSSFTDSNAPSSGPIYYSVRPIQLKVSASGSYYNPGIGALACIVRGGSGTCTWQFSPTFIQDPSSTTGSASSPTTASQTTGRQTTGSQTTGSQTTGLQTTGLQTTGRQTTGLQTTGLQTTGSQTTGSLTTAARTPQTTGQPTSGTTTAVQTTTAPSTTAHQSQTTTFLSSTTSEVQIPSLDFLFTITITSESLSITVNSITELVASVLGIEASRITVSISYNQKRDTQATIRIIITNGKTIQDPEDALAKIKTALEDQYKISVTSAEIVDSPSDNGNSNQKTGIIVGVVLGVTCIVAAVVGLIVIIIKKKKGRSSHHLSEKRGTDISMHKI